MQWQALGVYVGRGAAGIPHGGPRKSQRARHLPGGERSLHIVAQRRLVDLPRSIRGIGYELAHNAIV